MCCISLKLQKYLKISFIFLLKILCPLKGSIEQQFSAVTLTNIKRQNQINWRFEFWFSGSSLQNFYVMNKVKTKNKNLHFDFWI